MLVIIMLIIINIILLSLYWVQRFSKSLILKNTLSYIYSISSLFKKTKFSEYNCFNHFNNCKSRYTRIIYILVISK